MVTQALHNGRALTWARVLVRVALLLLAVLALHWGGTWLAALLKEELGPFYARWGEAVLLAALGAYVVFMALPFVPGMEISLVLMVLFGVRGIVLVWVATLLALSLSFTLGWRIPPATIQRLLGWLHLHRARQLVGELAPLQPDARLSMLLSSAPTRAVPFLLRHRYLVVALAFNIPGNALVGGGGGIALVAGMSGLFRFLPYLGLLALATAPIPVVLLLRLWLMA